MESRETWMQKNRWFKVKTNPKQTFDLNGHESPANSIIKIQGDNNKISEVKNIILKNIMKQDQLDGSLQRVLKLHLQLEALK